MKPKEEMTAVELLDKLSEFAERVRGMLWADGWHDLDEIADRLEEELSELDRMRCRLPEEHEEIADGGCYDDEDYAAAMWVREHGGVEGLKARMLPDGMEWPRFEDGEPVKFGDMALIDGEADMVEAVHLWIHGKPVICGDGGSQQLERGERVKRPAPKVLDADGVEIRVGERVWLYNSPEESYVVERIVDERSVKLIGFTYDTAAEYVTHRAPVIAADGRPLREGETVYVIGYDEPLTVGGFAADGRVLMGFHSGGSLGYRPDRLTHDRPDSWERLEDDADKNPFDYCKAVGHRLDTCENSEAYKARGLVRRARALAERDA